MARRLIASLETETSDKVEAAWREEIARWTRELDEDLVETIPGDQVLAEIRQRLHDSPAASWSQDWVDRRSLDLRGNASSDCRESRHVSPSSAGLLEAPSL